MALDSIVGDSTMYIDQKIIKLLQNCNSQNLLIIRDNDRSYTKKNYNKILNRFYIAYSIILYKKLCNWMKQNRNILYWMKWEEDAFSLSVGDKFVSLLVAFFDNEEITNWERQINYIEQILFFSL